MSKKSVAFTGAAALVAGIVIGSSGASSTAEVAEPQVKTVTKTKTVTEEVTPQSCLDAIEASEGIADQAIRFTDASTKWPNLVSRALQAGMAMDVAEVKNITADIEGITADYEDITVDTQQLVSDFNTTSADCQAAS